MPPLCYLDLISVCGSGAELEFYWRLYWLLILWHVVFFGIGAYTTGLMLLGNQLFWLGLLAGALVAALFAFLLGLPVLRLRGHYFAIATLGIAEAMRDS